MLLLLYLVLGVVAGALLPLQAGINAELSSLVGGPIRAAAVNFAVGLAALLLLAMLFARGRGAHLSDAPWWVWLGGLCGAFFVATNALVAPRLGAATLLGVVLAGQAFASLLIDRFGLVGFARVELGAGRIAGVALIVAGVAMVRYL